MLHRPLRNIPIRRIKYSPDESPISSIIGSILISLLSFTISLPISILFFLMCPIISTIRGCLFYIYCNRHAQSTYSLKSLTAHEIVYANNSFDISKSLLVLESDRFLTLEYFQEILADKIIPKYPKLKSRLVPLSCLSGVPYCWRHDTDFSISKHVFLAPLEDNSYEKINDYVSELFQKGLPKDKPPWEFQVVYGVKDRRETLVIFRIHRSLADGTSLMQLLTHCFADSSTITDDLPEQAQYGYFALTINMIRTFLMGPWTFFFWICMSSNAQNLLVKRNKPNMLSVTWYNLVPFSKVLRIKQITRSTVNCVLLSALAGALRQLLISCGVRRPPDIKVLIPVDIQSRTDTKLDNKASSVIVTLPVSIEGCVPRLWATRRTLDLLKTSSDSVLFYVATKALMTVAPGVASSLLNFLTNKANLQFASLLGPSTHIFIGGEKLKAIYNFLPAPSQIGISITAVTYAEEVHVGLVADPHLKLAAQCLIVNMETQIDNLWKLLLHRRVPGEGRHVTPIISSPTADIEQRLWQVQDELIRLTETEDSNNEALKRLRCEFLELLDELQSRRCKVLLRQRALSHTLVKRPSLISLKNIKTSVSLTLFKRENEVEVPLQSFTAAIPGSSACYRKNSYDFIKSEKSNCQRDSKNEDKSLVKTDPNSIKGPKNLYTSYIVHNMARNVPANSEFSTWEENKNDDSILI